MKTSIKVFLSYAIVVLFLVYSWYCAFFLISLADDSVITQTIPEKSEEICDDAWLAHVQEIERNVISIRYGCTNKSHFYDYLYPDQFEIKPFEVADPLYGSELYIFYIAQIVEQYYPDVDPYIALSVLETESHYQPNLTSSAGAIGLMQVIPKYHRWRIDKHGLNDLWDPYTNIICGIDLLNDLYQKYGSWDRALLGYNNSKSYVAHVLTNADILRGGNHFGDTASEDSGGSREPAY